MGHNPFVYYACDAFDRDAGLLAEGHPDACADLAGYWQVDAQQAARAVLKRVVDCIERHGAAIFSLRAKPIDLANHALLCDLDGFDAGLLRLKNNTTRGRGLMPHAETMDIPSFRDDHALRLHLAKIARCREAIAEEPTWRFRLAISYVDEVGHAGLRRRELLAAAGIKDTCMIATPMAAARLMAEWRKSQRAVEGG